MKKYTEYKDFRIMQVGVDFRQSHLRELLHELKFNIDGEGIRYFHIHTVENLIAHFNEILNENDKKWVYESLDNYFNICKEFGPSIDRDESKRIFYEHLDKLTDYYNSNLGFTLLMNRGLVYFMYFILLIILFYFFNAYVVLSVSSLLLLQIIYTFKKMRAKQVYGMYY